MFRSHLQIWIAVISLMDSALAENGNYLIDTPGCRIPEFTVRYERTRSPPACKVRRVQVHKINMEEVQFLMMYDFKVCCYLFVLEDTARKERCINFKNGTIVFLESEIVRVRCKTIMGESYEDVYAFVIMQEKNVIDQAHSYNVLMLGIESMSRLRAHEMLVHTAYFMKKYDWLDFRGFTKIAEDSYTNLDTIFRANICPYCKKFNAFKAYNEAGYTTAYVEDRMDYNFPEEHADHNIRRLFESANPDQDICTGNTVSGQTVLDYMYDFVNTYQSRNFFGFFWINSFGNTSYNIESHDKSLLNVLDKIQQTKIVKNTFIILFSTHGIRHGLVRNDVNSFYESRLPMLFISPPSNFKTAAPEDYDNLKTNRFRLVTPYDLHMTLGHILMMSLKQKGRPQKCNFCLTLLKEIPDHGSCADAEISPFWCPCRTLRIPDRSDRRILRDEDRSFLVAFRHLDELTKTIVTKPCYYCQRYTYKTGIRSAFYNDTTEYGLHYLVAFQVSPKNMVFEVMMKKVGSEPDGFQILGLETLSRFDNLSHCYPYQDMKYICMCQEKVGCKDTKVL